jgi:hypothetical protein
MPAEEAPIQRRGRSLATPLFWGGVGLAPLASLLLLVAEGSGPLRVAAVLAVLAVVLIGLSITLRGDAESVRVDLEETLLGEIDELRGDSRKDIATAARATHKAFGEKFQLLQNDVEALRGQLDAVRAASPAPAAFPAPAAGRSTAGPGPGAAVPGAVGTAAPAGAAGRSMAHPPPVPVSGPGGGAGDWFAPDVPVAATARVGLPGTPPTGPVPTGRAARPPAGSAPVGVPSAGSARVGVPPVGSAWAAEPSDPIDAPPLRSGPPAGFASVRPAPPDRGQPHDATTGGWGAEGGYDGRGRRGAGENHRPGPGLDAVRAERPGVDPGQLGAAGSDRGNGADPDHRHPEESRRRHVVDTGQSHRVDPEPGNDDRPGPGRGAGDRWASVRGDEHGHGVRFGERQAAPHPDESGSEFRVADRWAAARREEPSREWHPPAGTDLAGGSRSEEHHRPPGGYPATHPGAAGSARSAEGNPAIHGGEERQWAEQASQGWDRAAGGADEWPAGPPSPAQPWREHGEPWRGPAPSRPPAQARQEPANWQPVPAGGRHGGIPAPPPGGGPPPDWTPEPAAPEPARARRYRYDEEYGYRPADDLPRAGGTRRAESDHAEGSWR